jgi:hypothetical protein
VQFATSPGAAAVTEGIRRQSALTAGKSTKNLYLAFKKTPPNFDKAPPSAMDSGRHDVTAFENIARSKRYDEPT